MNFMLPRLACGNHHRIPVAVLIVLAASCVSRTPLVINHDRPGDAPTSEAVLASITISPPSATVPVGSTRAFVAEPKDENGELISAPITWASSDTAVGTIDSQGVFTALALGTSTVTASSGAIDGTATVDTADPTSAPTCTDEVKNGLETDTDCGGGFCPACADGKACAIHSDCASSPCSGKICSGATAWVTIPAGTFLMGSPAGEPCRWGNMESPHEVTLTHAFEMASTEVTQAQFSALMGYNPSTFLACGDDCPVETVSWHEAAAYCNALSAQTGVAKCYDCTGSAQDVTCTEAAAYGGAAVYACPGYRLPTDAEWEYAYRAGTTTAYYSGPNDLANCDECTTIEANADAIAWYCANSGATVHPVARKQPNAWGLYDMAGNVWEWCHDRRQADLGAVAVTDPWGAAAGPDRMERGGSWKYVPRSQRAAHRAAYNPPESRSSGSGLRCSKTI